MIKSEKINFLAKKTAPNPYEVTYWIDLTTDPNGGVIKSFNGIDWIPITQDVQQNEKLNQLQSQISTLNTQKADKATSLSGYGITDAYTITQVNSLLNNKVNTADIYTKDQLYTQTETDGKISQAVSNLVDQAPETLNTLNELADALGNDPNFATTISNQIGTKANSADVYTKSQVYTKTETNNLLNSKVSSTAVNSIQVVDEIPVDQTEGVLYIKLIA